jgi:acyl carrier protein
MDVTADVIAIVANRRPIAQRAMLLKLDDRIDELGLDSFATVEMIFDLEEKFDIQIPFNSNDTKLKFETVGEIVDAIKVFIDGRS